MVSVAAIGNTSWVCDPKLVSYALEQAERLISHARANKVVHNFAWNPLYNVKQSCSGGAQSGVPYLKP